MVSKYLAEVWGHFLAGHTCTRCGHVSVRQFYPWQVGLVRTPYPRSVSRRVCACRAPHLLGPSQSSLTAAVDHFQRRTVPLLKGLGLLAALPEDILCLQVTVRVCSQLDIATQNGRGITALGETLHQRRQGSVDECTSLHVLGWDSSKGHSIICEAQCPAGVTNSLAHPPLLGPLLVLRGTISKRAVAPKSYLRVCFRSKQMGADILLGQ